MKVQTYEVDQDGKRPRVLHWEGGLVELLASMEDEDERDEVALALYTKGRARVGGGAMPLTEIVPAEQYRREFPDYGPVDFAIPQGWDDTSWHNDSCPSWRNESLGLQLFADYADRAKRETPNDKRFALHYIDREGSYIREDQFESFADVERAIREATTPDAPLTLDSEQAIDICLSFFDGDDDNPLRDGVVRWLKAVKEQCGCEHFLAGATDGKLTTIIDQRING